MRLVAFELHSHDAILIASIIGAIGAIIAAYLGNMARRARSTGNGHSIGRGVAHIEELLHDVEDQLDRVEVQLREVKWDQEKEQDV